MMWTRRVFACAWVLAALLSVLLVGLPPAAAASQRGTVVNGAGGQDPARPFVESPAAAAQHAPYTGSGSLNAGLVAATSYYIGIQGAVQQHAEWCVPASSAVMLTHWDIYVAQQTLATAVRQIPRAPT